MMSPAGGQSRCGRRRAARLAAVQALYAIDVSGSSIERVLADVMDRHWSSGGKAGGKTGEGDADAALLRTLVEGVAADREMVDAAIGEALAEEWSLARLEILLQAILRAGTYELYAIPDIPARVVINEYLEIAHAFFAGREPALVNAVLDRIAARFRSGEPARGPADCDGT